MPTPTIPAGNLFMNATLYAGTGTTQNITNGVVGQSFQPDLVWIKNRSSANSHQLSDSVRGVNLGLASDLTIDEYTGNINAFNSNGFQTTGATNATNASGQTYVAWQWKAGGTAVTNTAGTISSQVSANTTSGFSIVTYTGNGTGGATVGHGLGVVPAMIIIKNRTTTPDWLVYHQNANATPQNGGMFLNRTDAFVTDSNYFNNTAPISTRFTIGTNDRANTNTNNYVAYCWAPIAGYSAFGSYTGNGSTDGPFLYMGFRPRFYMYKRADSTSNWVIMDTSRNPFNTAGKWLYPNLSNAENDVVATDQWDFLSNGLKVRSNGSATNASGGTYIYAAFAENPFKYANAR